MASVFSSTRPVAAVETHLRSLLERGRPSLPGGARSAMWMASIDLVHGGYPDHEPAAGKRVYRAIDAPQGCSLYWDQPLVTAARLLARVNAEPQLGTAAADYIREFLAKCVARNGLFLWGNHYFFQPSINSVVKFHVDEDPFAIDPATDAGELHEARPLTPNWQAFYEIAPEQTIRALQAMGERHVFDAASGGFNRHADAKSDHAFIEAGGVLVESLAWLAQKTGEAHPLELARRIARFSFSHRGRSTGLVENNPTTNRWDKHTATTEVALWASCLLRSARLTGEKEFAALAEQAVEPYLQLGYDEVKETYFGMLRISDGQPVLGATETIYQPADHVDFWHPLFPRHDYPFHFGMVCIELWSQTGNPLYRQGAERWGGALERALASRGSRPIYAEHYGRAIRLLQALATALARPDYQHQAQALADEAIAKLMHQGIFRGHTTEDRYDAVDGTGYLALALLHLAGVIPDDEPESRLFF